MVFGSERNNYIGRAGVPWGFGPIVPFILLRIAGRVTPENGAERV